MKLHRLIQEQLGSARFRGFESPTVVYVKCTDSNKLNCWDKPVLLLQVKHSGFEKDIFKMLFKREH